MGRRSQEGEQRHREIAARYSREKIESVSEIGPLPEVVNPERRAACEFNLVLFLETYFPHSTGLTPLSEDHRTIMIPRMQGACIDGGRVGNAIYRGAAKTTISENTAIWCGVYGHRTFVPLFGADGRAAERIVASIKRELETNELLAEDFPEVCFPIQKLEGKYQRCNSQTFNGERTYLEWKKDTVVFPTIPGSKASGFILSAHSIESASRGLKYKTAKGENRRPDLWIIDDAQTDESAKSETMTATRLDVVRRNIMRQSGHRSSSAGIFNATPIKPDDMVEQMMDRRRFPTLRWTKIPMMRSKSKHHDEFWLGEYKEIRHSFDPDDDDDYERAMRQSNELYRSKREYADEGCIVSWESCYDPDTEVSAIQHAYNILIDEGEDVFATECQMETRTADGEAMVLTAAAIQAKADGIARGECPMWVDRVTAFIDVQEEALYWSVSGFGGGFSGHGLDYGVFPEQPDGGMSYHRLRRKLSDLYPDMAVEARIRAALDDLVPIVLGKTMAREDGAELQVERLGIDSGDNTATIYEAIRRNPEVARIVPTKGRHVSVTAVQWENFPDRQGEQINRQYHWLMAPTKGSVNLRVCQYDTNWWKTFLYRRLQAPKGAAGCLTLFGEASQHGELALHLTSETRHVVQSKSRQATEWKLKPGRDNHLLDCFVGCCMLASVAGTRLDAIVTPVKKKAPTVRFSELQKARRN